jgi:hypothetical protein
MSMVVVNYHALILIICSLAKKNAVQQLSVYMIAFNADIAAITEM